MIEIATFILNVIGFLMIFVFWLAVFLNISDGKTVVEQLKKTVTNISPLGWAFCIVGYILSFI